MMSLIMDWAAQVWELLLTLGWWIAVGLVLSAAMQLLPLREQSGKSKNGTVLVALVCGVLMPVCNFAAIPLAVVLWSCEMGMGTAFAFLSAATLLNPAGMLSAWAYMGPPLALSYIFGAMAAAVAAAAVGRQIRVPAKAVPPGSDLKNRVCHIFGEIAPELACWIVLGIAAEALLMTLMPKDLWNQLLLDPKEASFVQAAAAGIFRHVCIPDDVALAASLAAAGLRPGCAVLFLLLGVCTNLPELFTLYGMAGKKTTAIYLATTAAVSVAAAFLTELMIGAGFVPYFNLANAESLTRIANLLSIRTWMPARIPCAIGLLLLACRGLWCRGKK